MAVVRALDLIFDRHGEPSDCTAVLAISGWARDVFKHFFFNETNHRQWSTRLEQTVPHVITLDRVRSLPTPLTVICNYTGPDYFKYHAKPREGPKHVIIQKRRHVILGPLFSNPANKTWKGITSFKSTCDK